MPRQTGKVSAPDGAIEVPIEDWSDEIKKLQDDVRELTRGEGGVDSPALDCTPNFVGDPCVECACAVVRQTGMKEGGNRGIRLRVKYRIPTDTETLITYIAKVADWDSADLTVEQKYDLLYGSKAIEDDITNEDRADGFLQADFKTLLPEETDFYIVMLRAKAGGRLFAQTPPVDPVPGINPATPGQHLAKFTTKKIIAAVPQAPDCSMIVTNKPNLNDEKLGNALVEVQFNVDAAGVLTVEELDVDRVVLYFLPVPALYPTVAVPNNQKAKQREFEIGRDNLVNPDGNGEHYGLKIPVDLPLGDRYALYKIKVINAGGKSTNVVTFLGDDLPPNLAVTPNCIFYAGGKVAGSDAEMPIPSIILVDNKDSRNTDVTVQVPNATPILLKFVTVDISYDGGVTYKEAGFDKVKSEEEIQVSGTFTKVIPIKHHKNIEQATWKLRARLAGLGKIDDGAGGFRAPRSFSAIVDFVPYYGVPLGHPSIAVLADVASTPNTDTQETDAFVTTVIKCFKSHPTDGSPMDGRDGAHSPAQPMSFKDAHATGAVAILYNDSAATTEKHRVQADISSTAERAANSITAKKVLAGMGDSLWWVKSRLWNGDGFTETVFAAPVNFRLGGLVKVSADVDVPTIAIQTITPIGNRHTDYVVRFTQPTPAKLLKRIDIEIKKTADATWKKKPPFSLAGNESYHVAGTVYDVPIEVSHPATDTFQVRFRIVTPGGYVSPWATAGATSTIADGIPDTAVPGTVATPNGQFIKGQGLLIRGMTVATNNNNATNIKEVCVKKSDSSLFFDLPTYFSSDGQTVQSVSEGSSRWAINKDDVETTLAVSLKHLTRILGTSIKVYQRVTNAFGTTTSADSSSIDLSTKHDVYGDVDAIAVLDVASQLNTGLQLISNGGMRGCVDNTLTTYLYGWGKVTSLPAIATPSTIGAVRNSGGGILWDRANRYAQVIDETYVLVSLENDDGTNVNGYIPEQFCVPSTVFSVTMEMKASAGGVSGIVEVFFVTVGGAQDATNIGAINIDDITTTFTPFGAKFSLDDTYTAGDKVLALLFTFTSGIDGSHPLEIRNINVVIGDTPKSFSPRPRLEGLIFPSGVTIVGDSNIGYGRFDPRNNWYDDGDGGQIIKPY